MVRLTPPRVVAVLRPGDFADLVAQQRKPLDPAVVLVLVAETIFVQLEVTGPVRGKGQREAHWFVRGGVAHIVPQTLSATTKA